jgi:hypothetical protein
MNQARDGSTTEAGMNESDFLKKQAEEAQAAIARALANAKASLAEGMDPREWTRAHPLVAVGSAVAAGFVAAVVTIPSKEEREIARLAKIQKAMNPPPPPSAHGNGDTKEHESVWKTLLLEAALLIRPVLGSLLSAGLKGQKPPPADGNGYGTPPPGADTQSKQTPK